MTQEEMTQEEINSIIKLCEAGEIKPPTYRRLHWYSIFYSIVCPECGTYRFERLRLTNYQSYRLYGACKCGWKWIGKEKREPWDD